MIAALKHGLSIHAIAAMLFRHMCGGDTPLTPLRSSVPAEMRESADLYSKPAIYPQPFYQTMPLNLTLS
jgi:hypothetical protein